MLKNILFVFVFISVAYGLPEHNEIYKQKQELEALKDELNDFYEMKELEYQKNKKQLEAIQKEIEKSEARIKKIKEDDQKVLDEINRVITSKAMLMYDKMKLTVVINIFNNMINQGKLDEVFDIMLRMKEKRVMKILKKLDSKISTIIMQKMRIVKSKEKEK